MGVLFAGHPPAQWDLCIDALLGIGSTRAPQGQMADWVQHINERSALVLAVDVPTGLHADTGSASACCASGQVWLDRLGVDSSRMAADAQLAGAPESLQRPRLHDSHKGTHGDVAVVGGAPGMVGAALLAASSALHAGAGRVMVSLLDSSAIAVDWLQPELMLRSLEQLDLKTVTVVCGCGGGSAIAATLPRMLQQAARLVLDADALNALAADEVLKALLRQRQRDHQTVLTPHPLEAARLLGCTTAQVQDNRLLAAQSLAHDLGCTVVLKGSGTVTAAPDHMPIINPSGNGLLATGGTGDVLAGLVGARMAGGMTAREAAWTAVYQHGWVADHWPSKQALNAGALARAMSSNLG
jgi:hydroxyethylthiazole kinase-like uncharacterized protein yjeF